MFTIPKSFTDPTLQTLSLEDFFNPIKNTFHSTGYKMLTVPQYEAALKALFTRENILANYEIFFNPYTQGHGLEKEDIKTLVSKIDDADLWKFAFMFIQYTNAGNKTTWHVCKPRAIDYNESRVDCNWQRDAFSSAYSYSGNNFGPEFIAAVQPAVVAWEAIKNGYSSCMLNMDSYIYGNNILKIMMKYIGNGRVYHSSDYLPDELFLIMQSSPTTVRVTIPGDFNNIKCSLYTPVTKANKSALHRTLSYSADVLDLLPWPLVTKGEVDPILYGVELEVATLYQTHQLIEASDEPFFACKQDSSISGSMPNKVEMVTSPMSLRSHKKEWGHLFSNLDYDKFDCTIETNNGMHVHIGRKNFSDAHLRTFAWFFGNPSNREFIVALSERKENQMHQYAAMPGFPAGASKVRSLKTVIDYFDMLRGAVNLHKSKPTVEVRIFKGIASYATILKNLEVVDAIFFFTQQCSQTSAGIREFLNFLRKTPRNKYPVLKEFIATLDTKKMLSSAQLNDLLFNVTDPKAILSIIERRKFPITSHHVTTLNAKQRTRTFIFNKETNSIEIVRTKYGKLSHLDRVLERKYTRKDKIVSPEAFIAAVHPERPPAPPITTSTTQAQMEEMAGWTPTLGHASLASLGLTESTPASRRRASRTANQASNVVQAQDYTVLEDYINNALQASPPSPWPPADWMTPSLTIPTSNEVSF
jgi:hypothetical protein